MSNVTSYIRESLKDYYDPGELKSLSIILCRDILKLNMLEIYSDKDNHLSERQREILESVIARLKRYEPIQHILGEAQFFGFTFKVSPDVLIPRPETEELIELILSENSGEMNVLDIGTGSGCIAISLSLQLTEAYVEAWDISPLALSLAKKNNENLNSKVFFRKIDIFANILEFTRQFDIIVSNPPYITESEKKVMDANVLDWEPPIALFVPDNDPLRFYFRIAELGKEMLTPKGKLYFEINQAYACEVKDMLHELNYKNIRVYKDLFKNDRIVTASR